MAGNAGQIYCQLLAQREVHHFSSLTPSLLGNNFPIFYFLPLEDEPSLEDSPHAKRSIDVKVVNGMSCDSFQRDQIRKPSSGSSVLLSMKRDCMTSTCTCTWWCDERECVNNHVHPGGRGARSDGRGMHLLMACTEQRFLSNETYMYMHFP